MASWEGPAWRIHKQKYHATDPTGSRYYSGRCHRASDLYRDEECWTALYLSLSPEACIGEILRHISPSLLSELNDYRLTEILLQLQRVIDVRDVQTPGFSAQDLPTAASYNTPQTVARHAIERGAEACWCHRQHSLAIISSFFPSS